MMIDAIPVQSDFDNTEAILVVVPTMILVDQSYILLDHSTTINAREVSLLAQDHQNESNNSSENEILHIHW
jgi:hypothetical protein